MCIIIGTQEVLDTLDCSNVEELTLATESTVDETVVDESEPGGTLASESGIFKTLVSQLPLHKTLVSQSSLHKSLVSEYSVGITQVYESSFDKTLVSESDFDKTLVSALDFDKTLVSELGVRKNPVSEPPLDKTPVSGPAFIKTRVFDLGLGKNRVSERSFNKTLFSDYENNQHIEDALVDEWVSNALGTESPMDENSDDVFMMDDDLEHDDSNESSSSMCIGTDLSDSSKTPEDGDEADSDNFGCVDMYRMPPNMWPNMNGFPFQPQCDYFYMRYMRPMQNSYRQQYPCPPYMTSRRSMCEEIEYKQAWKGWPSNGSNPVEVDPDMVVGAGLRNLGNTCFLNAILQCFTHTVPLVEGLRSYNHPKHCESDSEGFCVFCALHRHIELAITSTGKSISPLKIVENLNYISSDFHRYQQEDAHELLQCLLDKLDRSCNSSETDDSDESLVNQLFGGRLVSKLKCCNCGHCSDTFESLIDLSLEIENVSSLMNALESFTKVEKIEDEEPQFTCEGCEEKVTVEKQLMVDHAPSIAAFHLKRFKHDGCRVEKIDKHVEFPLELDLKPFTGGDQIDSVDLSYNLYAIVVHSGFSPTSGHYFCYVRSESDTWYRLDDSQVSKVSEFHVLSREAYILFYAKKGTPWFSTFMETEKTRLDSIVLTSSPKSVLETGNQSSESSPTWECNIINEVFKGDQRNAMGIGEAKNDSNTDNKSPPSPSLGEDLVKLNSSPVSVVHNMGQNSEPPSIMETNISEVCKEVKNDISAKKLALYLSQCNDSVLPNSESSPIIETNIATNVNEEDKKDSVGIPKLPLIGCKFENKVKEAMLTTLPKSTTEISDHIESPFNDEEAKISSDSNKENRGDSLEISRLPLYECGFRKAVNEAKDYRKPETRLTSSTLRGGNSSQRDGEFAEKAELNYSTSRESSSPGGLSKWSSDDCKLVDIKNVSGVKTLRRRQVEKSAAVDSSKFSGKEAYKAVKGRSCSRKRSRLMAAQHNYHLLCFGNKRRKLNRPSSKKKRSLNALHNCNLVSQRHIVPPGRFR